MKSQPLAVAVNPHIEFQQTLDSLLQTVRACRVCEAHLPLGPRPVLQASATARILIVDRRPIEAFARGDRVALMCAEAVPWRCHRSLIADALFVHGISTCEIVSPTRLQAHKLTPFACVHGTDITYPSDASDTSVAADGKRCV